jgi:DNA-binding IclR family transcriptional regulator
VSQTHIMLAADLLEKTSNRYELTLEVAQMAKRFLDESRERRRDDPFLLTSHPEEKVMHLAIYTKSNQQHDIGNDLIG